MVTTNADYLREADADNVGLQRSARHFAFRAGPHACLGAHLARLEMRVVLEGRHRRAADHRLRSGTSARQLPSGLIGIDSLPLSFAAEVFAAR